MLDEPSGHTIRRHWMFPGLAEEQSWKHPAGAVIVRGLASPWSSTL